MSEQSVLLNSHAYLCVTIELPYVIIIIIIIVPHYTLQMITWYCCIHEKGIKKGSRSMVTMHVYCISVNCSFRALTITLMHEWHFCNYCNRGNKLKCWWQIVQWEIQVVQHSCHWFHCLYQHTSIYTLSAIKIQRQKFHEWTVVNLKKLVWLLLPCTSCVCYGSYLVILLIALWWNSFYKQVAHFLLQHHRNM